MIICTICFICSNLPAIEDALIIEMGENAAMEVMRQLIIFCRLN
jgi:Ni,Fe-hydrogenase I large subunit